MRRSLPRTAWRVAIAALCLAAGLAGWAEAETLTYVLTPQRDTGRLQVELTWATKGRNGSTLGVAERWGRIDDVAALLTEIEFSGATQRYAGAKWMLSHREGATIGCRYVVDPGTRELDWDSLHKPITTQELFQGVGNAFLMVPLLGGGMPDEYEVLLRWRLPEGWKAACSWGGGRGVGARLRSHDLRHSVYLAGPLALHTTKVPGAGELTVAMPDSFGFDAKSFSKMASEIIAAQCAFMKDKSFPPFVVAAIPVGKAMEAGQTRLSGTGLFRSFVLWVPPRARLTEGVEHLFAHENFHHWNGKVLEAREPQGLVFWFTEGLTDYYALRILFESRRWDARTYAKWINRHIREYHANPARNAGNAEIEAGYWRQRDTLGEVPYQRGLLLGLRWHRLARDHDASEGLDLLFRTLVDRGRTGSQVSNESIRAAGVELLGQWFADEFDRHVTRAATVELPEDALAPELRCRVTTVHEYELGFDRERSLKDERVRGLVNGSAAAKAGVREDDELMGWEIHGDADKRIRLQVSRDRKLKSISYFPRGKRCSVPQFTPAGPR